MVTSAGQIRIGTSGWNYKHWRSVFYPTDLPVSRWFPFYCQHFDTVEINNTFYRLPPADVFVAWREQAPRGFLYAVKASRFLTHMKKLKDPEQPLENILGRSRKLGPCLGPVLYQLPPHWKCNVERLRAFIARLPSDIRHVFEFREPSWCNAEVRALLAETGMSYCIHDMRGFFYPRWVTGPLAYVRFHGPAQNKYAGRYGRAHLREWAEQIRVFQEAGHDVFVYFNNDKAGHAVVNAKELQGRLDAVPARQEK
jgi:uncharacterized protein YecE (DUF72 family)